MKCIEIKDNIWHPLATERPRFSLDVELKDINGNVVKGKLVSEMSGWYVYLPNGWGSLDDYTEWRFITDKDYSGYEQMCRM